MTDYATLNEIASQTTAWGEAIDRAMAPAPALRGLDFSGQRQVLCVGCGSTYYLAQSAAALLQSRTGVIARAFPASELLLEPGTAFVDGRTILVAISRSGATSETVRVVSDFKARRQGPVVVVTNYGDSPIARDGDVVLTIDAGRERSVAQTRSFASMHVAAAAIADLLGPDPLGDGYKAALLAAGTRLLGEHGALTRRLAADASIRQVFFLGSGPRFGLASEASLKLKEMSQTVSEPFHFFEFRHGPISMVDDGTLVVGLVSEGAQGYETAVLDEVRARGGRTLSIGETGTDVAFRSGVPGHVRNILYLPVLQLFAYERALANGKNPDSPRHLTAFVTLDLGA
ncbi:MAG TPA: SIS domain-containing protein [Bauldia sp.]|nr:SIS domain-containing protein [Bauldia sp.]